MYIDNGEHLFRLIVPTRSASPPIIIDAWDGGNEPGYFGAAAARIVVQVRQGGRVIFPRGRLYCGMPRMGGMTVDGPEARELVLSLVAMKPGDTDDGYFADYSDEQRAWAEEYGERLSCERSARYCCRECGSFSYSRKLRRGVPCANHARSSR